VLALQLRQSAHGVIALRPKLALGPDLVAVPQLHQEDAVLEELEKADICISK
jgi:hypothetical protein